MLFLGHIYRTEIRQNDNFICQLPYIKPILFLGIQAKSVTP